MGLLHVGLRPVGTEGAQQQPRHHPLPLVEGGQTAHEGDEGVGAWVEQVVVPEGPQGDVLGTVGPQRDRPRLFAFVEAQGIVVRLNPLDACLGAVGRELAAHHLVVQAAGHQHHSVHVPGQLQGEGFGHGDGLEEVLHAQQGALPGPRRSHGQQDGAFLLFVVSKQDVLRVQLHRGMHSFLYGVFSAFSPVLPVRSGPPLDDLGLLRRGLDADWEAMPLRQEQAVSPGT